MLKVYAYAGCDTCRQALKFLAARGIGRQVIPIREQPPTLAELKRMLALYDGELRKLFNTAGQDYKALNLKDQLPRMSVDQALKLLAGNGNLVKRPFALAPDGGRAGFKEAEWQAWLGADENNRNPSRPTIE